MAQEGTSKTGLLMPETQSNYVVNALSDPKDQMRQASVSLEGINWLWLYCRQGSNPSTHHPAGVIAGDVIKSSKKRLVICSPEGIFVKEVYYRGLRSLMKTLAGGNACKEGRMYLELSRRGIDVPNVLAFGVAKRFGLLRRDLLLTEKVKEALSLQEFIPSILGDRVFSAKQEFIQHFANFIKTLHNKGIQHTDLHVGNILVGKQNRARFYLLDVDRVILNHTALSEETVNKNIALLLCAFWSLSSSQERFRFLKFYAGRQHIRSESRRAEEIKQVALKISHRVWKKKAIRCLRTNSRFIKSRYKNFNIYRVRRPEIENALDILLPDPDDVLNRGVVLKDGRTVKAAKVEINGKSYFLKRYNCKGNLYRIRNTFRRSRAVRTWFATWGLTVRNVPVPKAFACLEERHFGLLERSYLLYEYVDGNRLCDVWPLLDDFGKRRMLSKLAITIGNMHLFGGFHGDLKWPNILVSEMRGRFNITLSDLDGSRIFAKLNAQKARRDIMRFLVDLKKTGGTEKFEEPFVEIWCKWSGNDRLGPMA